MSRLEALHEKGRNAQHFSVRHRIVRRFLGATRGLNSKVVKLRGAQVGLYERSWPELESIADPTNDTFCTKLCKVPPKRFRAPI